MKNLVVIILTLNEERHIQRAIESVREIADEILVVDSFSEDRTRDIAKASGASVFQHKFENHANQFNWALGLVDPEADWVLRLDADEVACPLLVSELKTALEETPPDVKGLSLRRRIVFMGKPIFWGGVFPLSVIRIFRNGHGRCEDRWMDEHIEVDGPVRSINKGELLDINLNPLATWIAKHNKYSTNEALEILNERYGVLPTHNTPKLSGETQFRRWLKEGVYYRVPSRLRPFIYFFYRYFIRFGFLDGARGTAFHILQGFWYRYLVELKVSEVIREMELNEAPASVAVRTVLGVDVGRSTTEPSD